MKRRKLLQLLGARGLVAASGLFLMNKDSSEEIFAGEPIRITAAYRQSITNQHLLEVLIQKENLPILEHLMEQEAASFTQLYHENFPDAENHRQNTRIDCRTFDHTQGQLDFGRIATQDELTVISGNVKIFVHHFLHIPKLSPCLVQYNPEAENENSCFYRWSALHMQGSIHLRRLHFVDLLPAIAHEYAHHALIAGMGLPYEPFISNEPSYQIFKEGHSFAVEKAIAQQKYEETGNRAYLYAISDALVFLRDAYIFVSEQHSQNPNKNLLSLGRLTCDDRVPIGRYIDFVLHYFDPHCSGGALFLVEEFKNHEKKDALQIICREAVHGRYVFS
ncbi:hypothetical protein HY495_00475 [Candidatus Woesearchaeota archaeon]|nr:hypothetical protein [Candidatus Woesearchaeota archaeon]